MYTRKNGEQQADIRTATRVNFFPGIVSGWLTERELRIIFALNSIRLYPKIIRKMNVLTFFLHKIRRAGKLPAKFCNVIGERAMPVYEYECQKCEKVFEVQQKIADEPLRECPQCQAPVKKLMSMSSFQLKGGGWYADGYSSAGSGPKNGDAAAKPAEKTAATPAPCQTGGSCAACPAATTSA